MIRKAVIPWLFAKRIAGLALGGWCGLAAPLQADNLTLAGDGERLTGTVCSINEAGVLELSSPLSPAPLLLKSGAVEKVEFSSKGGVFTAPGAMIELANGDMLPATVESLVDDRLVITTPDAGRLEIPRDSLKSVRLGLQRQKLVYAGPRSLDEWTGGEDGMKNWVFGRKSLIANGLATASKKLDLPERFTLRFTLQWQARQMPNFQIYFADPLKAKGEPCDRYYLRFSAAGLDIKREASRGKRHTDIQILNRTPDQYPDRRLQVEIQVDRTGSRLQLFLNGEPEGVFIDPVRPMPVGQGITLTSTAASGSTQEISAIEILELDDSRGRNRGEERGDPKQDSLISREDDRWGGRLIEIGKTGDGAVFRFKSDFQKDPLEIPEADVSTVFFAARDGGVPDDKAHPFVLRLRGEGALRVASCQFSEEAVSATHPLLGPLTFRREGIVALERTDLKPRSAPEP